VPFGEHHARQLGATSSLKQQLAKYGRQKAGATLGNLRHEASTRGKTQETALLTGGLLVRVQPEEPITSSGSKFQVVVTPFSVRVSH
jgi:hypothetical protein